MFSLPQNELVMSLVSRLPQSPPCCSNMFPQQSRIYTQKKTHCVQQPIHQDKCWKCSCKTKDMVKKKLLCCNFKILQVKFFFRVGHKIKLVRVWKRSCLNSKYLVLSPQTQLEISRLHIKNISFLSPQTDSNCGHLLASFPICNHDKFC